MAAGDIRQKINQILDEIVNNFSLGENLKYIKVVNGEQTHFMLLIHGELPSGTFTNDLLIHFFVKDNKVFLLKNSTEFPLADELVEKGIERERITLPNHSEEMVFV